MKQPAARQEQKWRHHRTQDDSDAARDEHADKGQQTPVRRRRFCSSKKLLLTASADRSSASDELCTASLISLSESYGYWLTVCLISGEEHAPV